MTLQERFPLLLTDPDYATSDLRQSPGLIDGVIVMAAYALVSSLAPCITSMMNTGSFGFTLLIFMGSTLMVGATWIFASILFRILAGLFGGEGEIVDTLRLVGLSFAPMIPVFILITLMDLIGPPLLGDEGETILVFARLGLNLIGMVWGFPGVLCFYGLRNAELLDSAKAFVITFIAFLAMAFYAVYDSPFAQDLF